MSKEVFACVLSTNDYLEGVLVLNENLKFLKTQYDLICLINETISEETKNVLDYFQIKYLLFPKIEYDNYDEFNSHWVNTFDKFNVFRLTDYEKVVYLDSDLLILKNIDHLFLEPIITMARDIPFHKDKANSCIMVIKPNMKDFNNLVELAKKRNDEGKKIGDQDIINEYFDDIRLLPDKYNDIRSIAPYESEMYLDIKKEIVMCNGVFPFHKGIDDPIVVHYIGKTKPFMVEHDFVDKYKYFYLHYLSIVRRKEAEYEIFNKDLISIIMPLYNKEEFIKNTINSILEQTYTNFELIIVDDNSTDNSKEIIEKINDKRIKLIKLKENMGVSHARNVGIDNAKGKYITFIDADDMVANNFLEEMHNKIELYKADVSQCQITIDDKIVGNINEYEVLFPNNSRCFIEFFYDRIPTKVFGKLIKKELLGDKLRFDENYKKNEDYLFILNLLNKTERYLAICDSLYFYKPNNINKEFNYKLDKNLLDIYKYLDNISKDKYLTDNKSIYSYKISFLENFYKTLLDNNVSKEEVLKDTNYIDIVKDINILNKYPELENIYNEMIKLKEKYEK